MIRVVERCIKLSNNTCKMKIAPLFLLIVIIAIIFHKILVVKNFDDDKMDDKNDVLTK